MRSSITTALIDLANKYHNGVSLSLYQIDDDVWRTRIHTANGFTVMDPIGQEEMLQAEGRTPSEAMSNLDHQLQKWW